MAKCVQQHLLLVRNSDEKTKSRSHAISSCYEVNVTSAMHNTHKNMPTHTQAESLAISSGQKIALDINLYEENVFLSHHIQYYRLALLIFSQIRLSSSLDMDTFYFQ